METNAIVGFGVLGAIGIGFIWGWFSGQGKKSGVTPTVPQNPLDKCESLCNELRDKRLAMCDAKKLIAQLEADIRNTQSALNSATASAAVLVAAAAVAALIPIFGPAIAYPISVAAAAALSLVAFLTGKLMSLQSTIGGARIDLQQKDQEERMKLVELGANCTQDKVAACLSLIPSC